jgi:hypothetical protein
MRRLLTIVCGVVSLSGGTLAVSSMSIKPLDVGRKCRVIPRASHGRGTPS